MALATSLNVVIALVTLMVAASSGYLFWRVYIRDKKSVDKKRAHQYEEGAMVIKSEADAKMIIGEAVKDRF